MVVSIIPLKSPRSCCSGHFHPVVVSSANFSSQVVKHLKHQDLQDLHGFALLFKQLSFFKHCVRQSFSVGVFVTTLSGARKRSRQNPYYVQSMTSTFILQFYSFLKKIYLMYLFDENLAKSCKMQIITLRRNSHVSSWPYAQVLASYLICLPPAEGWLSCCPGQLWQQMAAACCLDTCLGITLS